MPDLWIIALFRTECWNILDVCGNEGEGVGKKFIEPYSNLGNGIFKNLNIVWKDSSIEVIFRS